MSGKLVRELAEQLALGFEVFALLEFLEQILDFIMLRLKQFQGVSCVLHGDGLCICCARS